MLEAMLRWQGLTVLGLKARRESTDLTRVELGNDHMHLSVALKFLNGLLLRIAPCYPGAFHSRS